MPVDPAEFRRFSEAVTRPAVLREFAVQPLTALERAGVDLNAVPKEAVDVLAELSPEELDVLARVSRKVHGIPSLAADGGATGYVVF
jgi:hypothetical protein